MATDEAILGRTIAREFRRDAAGWLEQPEALYRSYEVQAGTSKISCLFRDHAMSDLIGFVYAGWDADDAASDFVNRLAEAGRRFSAVSAGEEATIAIILDGENAWEHFEGGGRPFLRALYGKLASHPELRSVTMSEATAPPGRALSGIFPGSWIDGNFFIWIGHADDIRGWRQLREARQMFGRVSPDADPDDREKAFKELLIAEGSDWFWWYGDDHSSNHDLEFDELFRRHIRNIYQLLGQPIPEELFATNITTGQIPLTVVTPVGLLRPVLDGRATSYFEWLPAGIVETTAPPAGTMTGSDRQEPAVKQILFGFDLETLFLRFDLPGQARQKLADGMRISINFTTPADRRLVLSASGRGAIAELQERTPGGQWAPVRTAAPTIAALDIVEAAVPFADLGLRPNHPLAFFVSIQNGGRELERYPPHRPVETAVPDPAFEKFNWKA